MLFLIDACNSEIFSKFDTPEPTAYKMLLIAGL